MSDTEEPDNDPAAVQAPEESTVTPRAPEFSEAEESSGVGAGSPLDSFYDVQIRVWAELGRLEMPIGELMKLSDGAVVKLQRPVSQPVDVMAQGVRVARGEVVVIDDCFAVRITEIENSPRIDAR